MIICALSHTVLLRPYPPARCRELSVTRQVIKLGSSSIASRDGLALDVIAGLVSQIASAQRAGHEIILVTSGATRLGQRLLAFEGPTAGAAPALRDLVGSVRSSIAAVAGAGEGVGYGQLVDSLEAALPRYELSDGPAHALEVALPA